LALEACGLLLGAWCLSLAAPASAVSLEAASKTKGPATRPLLVSGLLSEAIRVQLIPGPLD